MIGLRNSIDDSLRGAQNLTILNSRVQNIENRLNNISFQDQNPFKDKWISILGDSISTYKGWVPIGNNTQYPSQDVNDVTKTWWNILLRKLGAKLCVNQSWNGRKVSGERENDVRNATNKLHREVGTRYINLDGTTEIATKRQDPDIILIMLGINDFNGMVPVGTPYFANSPRPPYNNSDFAKSYEAMIMDITGYNYKKAKIYCLNITYACNKYGLFVPNGDGNSKLINYRKAIEEIATGYECNTIHVNRLDVHAGNMKANYSSDELHPNSSMMTMIANQCYTEMMASNCL